MDIRKEMNAYRFGFLPTDKAVYSLHRKNPDGTWTYLGTIISQVQYLENYFDVKDLAFDSASMGVGNEHMKGQRVVFDLTKPAGGVE